MRQVHFESRTHTLSCGQKDSTLFGWYSISRHLLKARRYGSILLSVRVETAPNQLSTSADADHTGADDRRSVSKKAVMLAGAMVAWSTKRQPVTAISSTGSEFYSVS